VNKNELATASSSDNLWKKVFMNNLLSINDKRDRMCRINTHSSKSIAIRIVYKIHLNTNLVTILTVKRLKLPEKQQKTYPVWFSSA